MQSGRGFRSGMQVHAVPEAERAFDASGRRLPWGYEYADTDRNDRRTEEKGPFGKSTRRRGTSRSRTGTTPARTQADKDNMENLKAMDAAMNNFKERSSKQTGSLRAQPSQSMPNLSQQTGTDAQPSGTSESVQPAQTVPVGAPTEVVIYGMPSGLQYAALSFFERVSGGRFYEDYARDPPTQRFNSLSHASRASQQRTISEEALRKKNRFAGGDNWIKITFDSQESADRACHASPHVIKGYLVHAEPYRGVYQRDDVAIPATERAVQSATASPSQASSRTAQQAGSISTSTASSATATMAQPAELRSPGLSANGMQLQSQSTTIAPKTPGENTLRIRGAKRAVLLPAEQALLPATSVWQRTLAKIPVVGWLLAGGGELIGGAIPRKEDGAFDLDKASVWWRFWYQFDAMTGADTCGLRGGYED